jgi:DNA-directed RNA polymerase subunit omega
MARVTVEDCSKIIGNRFELVVLAAQRTKDIFSGAPVTINPDKDKNPVIALREIASGNIDPDVLRSAFKTSLLGPNKVDEIEAINLYADAKEKLTDEVDYSETPEIFSHDEVSTFSSEETDFSNDPLKDK